MHVRKLNGKLITPQYITGEDSMPKSSWYVQVLSNLHSQCSLCKAENQHVVLGEVYEGRAPLIFEQAEDGYYLPTYVLLSSALGKRYRKYYYTTGQREGFLKGIESKMRDHFEEFHPDERPWGKG